MNKTLPIHRVIPKLINAKEFDQYVISKCKCPLDLRYVLAVNVNDLTVIEKQMGVCKMYCPNCGTETVVGFKFGYDVWQ